MISRRHVVRFGFALVLAGLTLGLPASAATAQPQSDRFYVMGFIKNPGAYFLDAGMTVGDAIETAGGFSAQRAATIQIIRMVDGEKQTLTASFNDAVVHNDTIDVK